MRGGGGREKGKKIGVQEGERAKDGRGLWEWK